MEFPIDADGSLVREDSMEGKPSWQWETPLPDLSGRLSHLVWLKGDEDDVQWEVWDGPRCLGIQDTGKKGSEEAVKLVQRVRKNGQAKKFGHRVYKAWQEEQL
jgi:hypothetical protein